MKRLEDMKAVPIIKVFHNKSLCSVESIFLNVWKQILKTITSRLRLITITTTRTNQIINRRRSVTARATMKTMSSTQADTRTMTQMKIIIPRTTSPLIIKQSNQFVKFYYVVILNMSVIILMTLEGAQWLGTCECKRRRRWTSDLCQRRSAARQMYII